MGFAKSTFKYGDSVTNLLTARASIAALLVCRSVSAPTEAQTTIVTTTERRQEGERWIDPANSRSNTRGELRGMAITVEGRRTGQELSARVYGSAGNVSG